MRIAHVVRVLAPACFACLALGAPPPAAAESSPSPPTTSPAPQPAPAPVAGRIELVPKGVGGKPPFAIVGARIGFRGIVTPYVAGQTVSVSVYRDGRQVEVKTVSVLPVAAAAGGTGVGGFQVSFVSRLAGLVQARAVHDATGQQAALSARSPGVRFVNPKLAPGERGQSVRLLQSELHALHYAVPLSGVLDEGTEHALIAYRKMTGLQRIAVAGRTVFEKLERRAGSFHVRYRRDGKHVEANLARQVLAEIEPGGRVHAIYDMSSGKPSTPTVLGRFHVYLKTPGVNSEGMVDSNYFIRGYAIHGYPEVPTYAASHGCLRVPIPEAPSIFAWVQLGTPVDVYG